MRHVAQRSDIRDLILDGVDVLLAQYGYKKMTMEDLAQQVGIGKGTIYLHFTSKEELTLAHIDRITDRLLHELRVIAESGEPADKRLRKMLVLRVLFRFDSVRHYSQSLNDLLSSLRKEFLVRRQEYFQKEMDIFSRVLEEGKKEGVLRFADKHSTAQVLVWSTNSLLPYSLTTRELGSRADIEERVTRIANLILRGLGSISMKKRHRPLKQQKTAFA
ncbi:MAG TPA: TetR/AcrR family transcriptional regulator [Acidobacteriota bacterium]|nr:TetR/AcrR family transcriptional regulator [Acidobacteriota bacterium]